MAIYSVKATKRKRVCHLRSTVTMRPFAVPENWQKCVWFRLVQGSMLVGDDGGKSAGRVLKQVHAPLEDSSAQSVLVVRLLLARAGNAVLGLAGARAKAVQSPTILCVINVVFKEKLFHPEERHAGEQRV